MAVLHGDVMANADDVCVQGSIFFGGTMWAARNLTWVSYAQGKCPTCYAIALALMGGRVYVFESQQQCSGFAPDSEMRDHFWRVWRTI